MQKTRDSLRGLKRAVLAALLAAAGCSGDDDSSGQGANQPGVGGGGGLASSGGTAGISGVSGAVGNGGAVSSGSGGAVSSSAGAGPMGAGGAAPGSGGAMPAAGGLGSSSGGASPSTGGAVVDGGGMGGGSPGDGACTRESLRGLTDQYFEALSAQDASNLPLAPGVKFTENGEVLEVGEGLWANAGETKFKLHLLDTEMCTSVTQSVVADGRTDIPLGLRLKVVNQQITEIEHIAVRSGDYLVPSNTGAMTSIDVEPWEAMEPPDSRWPRDRFEGWFNKYFKSFPRGVCDLSSGCRRMENGYSLACTAGASCAAGDPPARGVMNPRLIVVDTEANMAAGFVMFMGTYSDFHMIKVKDGEVQGVYTILAEADGSGWD